MITSKITSKAQTTIPQPVREALRVREGDELAYKIERGRVILTKATRAPSTIRSQRSANGIPRTTSAPMSTFRPWDIVKVPFPYVERPIRQYRPALVVSAGSLEAAHGLVWVLMITSADNRRWEDDIVVSDLGPAGLPVPSVVGCAKIATIGTRNAKRIGILPPADRKGVAKNLRRTFAAVAAR